MFFLHDNNNSTIISLRFIKMQHVGLFLIFNLLNLTASFTAYTRNISPFSVHPLFSMNHPSEQQTQDLQDPVTMKIKDIQAELKNKGVSYVDCFDRTSIVQRLLEARRQTTTTSSQPPPPHTTRNSEASTNQNKDSPKGPEEDEILVRLRLLSVKELRTECSKYNIRWGQMIEKEDLIQALLQHHLTMANQVYSLTGNITPSQVADISGDVLQQELKPGNNVPPLLLDVYATWCGPCQLMASQLKQVAQELGSSMRVTKIDSDKYPEWASSLRVQGLPTLIVFDGSTGKEVHRIEGAMMKDTLLQVLQKYI